MDRNNRFIEPDRGFGMMGWAIKQLAFWSVAGFVLYAVLTNRQLFQSSPSPAPAHPGAAARTAAPADPAPSQKLEPLGQAVYVTNTLTLRAQSDGYAWVDASVNGASMKMAFDTGASYVTLTEADAQKAGVAGNLIYSVPLSTANGTNPGAPVMLHEVRIGQLVIQNVNALVVRNMARSLLGQTFLHRLKSFHMEGRTLTLSW